MSLQYLTNDNPPPAESALQYDIEPSTVFISTGAQTMYANLTITVFNPTSETVNCMGFQFGFLAGASTGNLTTASDASVVSPISDQNEWNIVNSGFINYDNANLYLFTATPSGIDNYLALGAGASLVFHLNNILIDQSVGEGTALFTIIEQTGTRRVNRQTVQGTLDIEKAIGGLAITAFSVDPPTPIVPGTPVILSWALNGSDHWQLYDSDTSMLLYDSNLSTPPNLTLWPVPPQQLTPQYNTSYEVIAWAGQIFTNAFAEAQVTNPRFISIGLPTATPQSVDSLMASTLSWQTADAQYVVVAGGGFTSAHIAPDSDGNGQLPVNPVLTTTYTVTPYSANGVSGQNAQVTVTVNPPTVVSFAATPNLFAPGATVSLSWQTQSGVSASLSRTTFGSNEVISMGSVDLNSNGYTVEPPAGLTTYILTVVGQEQTTGQVAVATQPQTVDANLASLQADIVYDNVNLLLWELSGWAYDIIYWRNASNGNLIGQTNYALTGDLFNAMAFDGQFIWVTTNNSGLIQIQASNGNVLASGIQQANLTAPSFISYDSANQLLWVVHSRGSAVSRIKTSDQTLAGPDITFQQVQSRPTFDGANAWLADVGAQELCIYQGSDGTTVQKVQSNAACLTFDGNNVWAGCMDGHVRKFDGQGNVLASYRAADYFINDILFDGTNIWTANFDDQTVSMIDAADGTLLAAFPMSTLNPKVLAFDGASIWILCSSLSDETSLVLKLVAASPPAPK